MVVCIAPRAQKGKQDQRLYNNQLNNNNKMPRGVCGRSPHLRHLMPGDGEYSDTHPIFRLSLEVRKAGVAPSHCKSVIMAMEIIVSRSKHHIKTQQRVQLSVRHNSNFSRSCVRRVVGREKWLHY